MAEAIGLVASVVQLAGTGLKLSQALYQYADGVANADRRIREVAKEIKLTSCVIEELGNVFKQDETLSLISNTAVATANETLKECSALFGEIEITLNKSKKGKMGRLMLPFRENRMELHRNHIDKLKSTLQLLMQVLLHAHQVASNRIDREAESRQRDEIRQLLEEKKNTTKKYEDSLRNFAASDSSTEVEDDAFSLDDKESDSMVEINAIASTVDPDSLAECMKHVQTLLASMERLQNALVNRSEGDDHSNHHQTTIESYFVARSHLDSILLGSSNGINDPSTELHMRVPTSNKTSIPASRSKPWALKKEKEVGSLVIETTTTTDAEKEMRQETISSHLQSEKPRQKAVPEQASTEVRFGGPPAVIQGNVFGRSQMGAAPSIFAPQHTGMTYSYSYNCSPQITESQPSLFGSASDHSNINPTPPRIWVPNAVPHTVEPSAYFPPTQHRKEDVVVENSYVSSRYTPHGLGSQTGGERRESAFGRKANDLPEATPRGNDEVDELLREWTTCFA